MATEKFDIPSLEEIDEIKDNTQLIGYDPDSLDTVKHKNFTFQTLREKMSELIVFLTGLRLNPSRIAMQELTSGSLSVSGWYTIAETLTSAFQPASSKFNIIVGGAGQAGSIEFIAQISQSTSLKTNINSKIEILGSSSTNTNGILGIRGVRIAKSDSVSNAGSKLQVNIVVSPTVTLDTILIANNGSTTGWELIAPTQTDINLLPDGVTAATFLEAGEELSFDTSQNRNVSGWISELIDKDTIRCEIIWDQIPKQASTITLTPPATDLSFRNYGDNSASIASFTTSGLQIIGRRVMFTITQTDIALGLTFFKPVFPRISGTGCKLTLNT